MTHDQHQAALRRAVAWAMAHEFRMPVTVDEALTTWQVPAGMVAAAMGLTAPGQASQTVERYHIVQQHNPASVPPARPGAYIVGLSRVGEQAVELWSYWDDSDWRGIFGDRRLCLNAAAFGTLGGAVGPVHYWKDVVFEPAT